MTFEKVKLDEMTERETILKIKKKGKLIAIGECRSYWVMDGVMYSINTDGESYSIWCSEKEMNSHLHRLMQVIGRKFFSESDDIVIIDNDYIAQFPYA